MVAKQLAALGHTTGDEPGQVPTTFVDWRLAMTRESDWHGTSATWSGASSIAEASYRASCSRTPRRSPGSGSPPSWSTARRIPAGRSTSGDDLRRRMPRAELELIDGGGHLVWYDNPGRVGARVTEFLAS